MSEQKRPERNNQFPQRQGLYWARLKVNEEWMPVYAEETYFTTGESAGFQLSFAYMTGDQETEESEYNEWLGPFEEPTE